MYITMQSRKVLKMLQNGEKLKLWTIPVNNYTPFLLGVAAPSSPEVIIVLGDIADDRVHTMSMYETRSRVNRRTPIDNMPESRNTEGIHECIIKDVSRSDILKYEYLSEDIHTSQDEYQNLLINRGQDVLNKMLGTNYRNYGDVLDDFISKGMYDENDAFIFKVIDILERKSHKSKIKAFADEYMQKVTKKGRLSL